MYTKINFVRSFICIDLITAIDLIQCAFNFTLATKKQYYNYGISLKHQNRCKKNNKKFKYRNIYKNTVPI